MARNDQAKVYTIKRAQGYLSAQGTEMSSQQVRNLARTNEIVSAGVTEYTDPVTEETYKVISQAALDQYIAWRKANPEGTSRRGRAATNERRYVVKLTTDQFTAANDALRAAGLPELSAPPKQVRKPRKAAEGTSDGNGMVSTDQPLEELELIEVE
jgi:hypothetical protein